MQPGVTVVLATVWLAACVVGTVSYHPSRLTLDQYSPLAPQPRQHGVYRRVEGQLDWKDQNPAENQPFDLSIGPRRSISTSSTGPQGQSHGNKYEESDSLLRRSRNSAGDNFSPLVEDKQPRNFVGREFTDEKADSGDTKGLESASRELSPPSELEDPFVADDTFQDQGPGSVEIYKLDLLREKSLLSPTPVTRFPSKSKAPKKTNHVSWKFKPSDYKATSLKMLHKQSNSFDDSSTEVPPNTDPFSIGGVPELQVGCEGLEASDHGKERRSIDPPARDKNPKEVVPWADVTPVSLNLDYDLSGEEGDEEMDELLKLKKSETTTERIKQNRGDMDATLYSNFHDDKRREEKLPVRGDLGKSSARNKTAAFLAVRDNRKTGDDQPLHFYKRRPEDYDDDVASRANQRRRILWLDDSNGIEQQGDERREKRDAWGFGEDEGTVNSGELQTRNQRRRLDYERWRKEQEQKRQQVEEQRRREDAQRRGLVENRTGSDIERIREEYEKSLELRQRQEEERLRRLQSSNRWQQLDEQRRRSQEEESRRNRWQEEQGRRQELEESRKRQEALRAPVYETEWHRLRQQKEEARRRNESRSREEENRRRLQAEEEARKRQQSRWEEEARRRQELDRRNVEERRREWMLKQKQQEEDEKRRQHREEEERRRQEFREEERRWQQQQNRNEPSNLSYPPRSSPNGSRSYDAEIERERQRKLNEYIQRYVPINLNDSTARQREEEAHRRKLEEERKLREYLRRMQNQNESNDRNLFRYRGLDEARQYNRSRYPGPGNGRKNHGPSVSTIIEPRSYVSTDEARRRIEHERMLERRRQQQLRREALMREEEVRREQSRRYEEQRRRQEAARLEAERLAKVHREEEARRNQARKVRPLENTRPSGFDVHSRPDASLIPDNLFRNESRRAMELERQRQELERQRQEHERQRQEYERQRQRQRQEYERQRQEQERRRLEAERRKQSYNRPQETWKQGQRTREMTEEEKRREEARLNALSVKARIIIEQPKVDLEQRANFDRDIDFPGISPHRPGMVVANFPVAPTEKPPRESLPPCVWAVVHCCSSNINRLVNCFEAMGCPGIHWDPEPCRESIVDAAKKQVNKFYQEEEEDYY